MRESILAFFVDFYERVGQGTMQKTLAAVWLFDFLDRLRIKNFPDNWYEMLMREGDRIIAANTVLEECFDLSQNSFDDWKDTKKENVENQTGSIYYNLWKNFKKEEYYQQTYAFLKARFEKNNITFKNIKTALDDGCGGGRYTLALKKLGCEQVTGIDISPDAIHLAQKMNPFGEDVNFKTASVLDLPFHDHKFDFVFSNGVLHHTTDTKQGMKEIFRVLKKGGHCWLYLYGGKQSFFWDVVDVCRKLLSDVPQSYTQTLMKVMGYPPGRIFHRADFFYVPINNRYFKAEIDEMLNEIGFSEFRRLNRGVAYDWDEIIFQNPHIDPYIYGEGEMRYWLTK